MFLMNSEISGAEKFYKNMGIILNKTGPISYEGKYPL